MSHQEFNDVLRLLSLLEQEDYLPFSHFSDFFGESVFNKRICRAAWMNILAWHDLSGFIHSKINPLNGSKAYKVQRGATQYAKELASRASWQPDLFDESVVF